MGKFIPHPNGDIRPKASREDKRDRVDMANYATWNELGETRMKLLDEVTTLNANLKTAKERAERAEAALEHSRSHSVFDRIKELEKERDAAKAELNAYIDNEPPGNFPACGECQKEHAEAFPKPPAVPLEPVFPSDGMYQKLPIPVRAQRQDKPFEVKTLEGTMRGDAGDWLITGPGGEQWPIKDEVFRRTYRRQP